MSGTNVWDITVYVSAKLITAIFSGCLIASKPPSMFLNNVLLLYVVPWIHYKNFSKTDCVTAMKQCCFKWATWSALHIEAATVALKVFIDYRDKIRGSNKCPGLVPCTQGRRQRGDSGARSPFKICAPHFIFGARLLHTSIIVFKECAPPYDFWPPCCEILARGCLYNYKHRETIIFWSTYSCSDRENINYCWIKCLAQATLVIFLTVPRRIMLWLFLAA